MMMDAAAEEYAFRIDEELVVFLAGTVALVIFNDVLQHLSHCEIVLAVLVPVNVPSEFCSLAQVIDILFLFQCQFFPPGNLIPHDLDISKLIHEVLEIAFLLVIAVRAGRHSSN